MNINPEIIANITRQLSVEATDSAQLYLSEKNESLQLSDSLDSLIIRVSDRVIASQNITLADEISVNDNLGFSDKGLFHSLEDTGYFSEKVLERQIEVSDYIEASGRYYNSFSNSENISISETPFEITAYSHFKDYFLGSDDILLSAEILTNDNFEIDESQNIFAYLYPRERILSLSRIPEIFADLYVAEYLNEFSDTAAFENIDITEPLHSFFPDYFYNQGPYNELIKLIGYRASLNYNISELINIVYDVDNLPNSYYYYNKILKLIGLEYDFSDLPVAIIKNIANNYLSIRKYRGTKASVLAVLRMLDSSFISNPSNPCKLNIALNDITTESGFVIEKALLSIEYANLDYPEAAYYLLSKVIPTGLSFELVSRYIRTNDSLLVRDIGEAIDKNLYTISVSDTFKATEVRSFFEFSVKDRFVILDYRNSAFSDRVFVKDRASIFVFVSDQFHASEKYVSNTMRISEVWPFEIEKTRYIYGGKIVETSDSFNLSDSAATVTNVPWEYRYATPDNISLLDTGYYEVVKQVEDSMTVSTTYNVTADLLYKNVEEIFRFRIEGEKQEINLQYVSDIFPVSESINISENTDGRYYLSEQIGAYAHAYVERRNLNTFYLNDSMSITEGATAGSHSTNYINFDYSFILSSIIKEEEPNRSRGVNVEPDRVIHVSENIDIDFVD